MTYAKLFGTITDSSLWSASKDARILFVSMLARADSTGFVEAALPGLARIANLSLEETEKALADLMAPDPHSKSPDHEGRRVVVAPRGWCLVNYEAYRERRNEEERREYMRDYMKQYRKQTSKQKSLQLTQSKLSKPPLAQAETETETETGRTAVPVPDQKTINEMDEIMKRDQETSRKAREAPLQPSWQDWRQSRRLGIARTGEDGDMGSWKALWNRSGEEVMGKMYAALLPTLAPGKRIWYSQALDWINERYEDA